MFSLSQKQYINLNEERFQKYIKSTFMKASFEIQGFETVINFEILTAILTEEKILLINISNLYKVHII